MGTIVFPGLNAVPTPISPDRLDPSAQVAETTEITKIGGPLRKSNDENLRKSTIRPLRVAEKVEDKGDPRDDANTALAETDPESKAYKGTQISVYV